MIVQSCPELRVDESETGPVPFCSAGNWHKTEDTFAHTVQLCSAGAVGIPPVKGTLLPGLGAPQDRVSKHASPIPEICQLGHRLRCVSG